MKKETCMMFDETNKKFHLNGVMQAYENDQLVYSYVDGYKNLDKKNSIQADSLFPINRVGYFFIGIIVTQLLEKGILSLDDLVVKYIPELTTYPELTIKQILLRQSGIPDFDGSIGLESFNYRKEHNLSDLDYCVYQAKALYEFGDPLKMVNRIKALKPENKPGLANNFSKTDNAVMALIIGRVTKKSIENYLNEQLFAPLGISPKNGTSELSSYVRSLNSSETYYVGEMDCYGMNFSMKLEDIVRIIYGVINHQFFTKKSLHKYFLLMNDEDYGLSCSKNGDTYSLGSYRSGYQMSVCFDIEQKAITIYASNVKIRDLRVGPSEYKYYSDEIYKFFVASYLIPSGLKMVPVTQNNGWSVYNMELSEAQEQFVSGPRDHFVFSLICHKTVKQFMLMDKKTAVGLISLEVDKKHNSYYICNLMVSREFQGRGYGSKGVKLGIDYLVKKGAKKININFRAENKIAQACYEKCGFKVVEVDWAAKMEYLVK